MSDAASVIIVALLVACVGFIAAQIRGCNQDVNQNIKSLAEQGIRAEMAPNSTIRVIDTRDFRASKGEK